MTTLGLRDLPKVANELFNTLHEDELELIKELYALCEEENSDEVDRLMDMLLYDVEDHFSTEEELMREAEFFAYPMHKAEHDSMRKEIKELYSSWRSGRNAKEIMHFLKERLIP